MGKYKESSYQEEEHEIESQINEEGSQLQGNHKTESKKGNKMKSANQISKNKSKLGRPSNKDKSVQPMLKYSEVDLIKHSFLKYLLAIGYDEGLIFTHKQRVQLQKQQQKNDNQLPAIKWDDQHTWVMQQQIRKVKQIVEVEVMPLLPIQIRKQKIYENLLDIADIFPREVTNEVYLFLCHLFIIVFRKEGSQQQVKQFVDQMKNSQKYVFLTGRFSKEKKVLTPEKLITQMQLLCSSIIKQFNYLFKKLK